MNSSEGNKMKQLFLSIMVSVVCSIVAVSWFSSTANAHGSQQGSSGSRHAETNGEGRKSNHGEGRQRGHGHNNQKSNNHRGRVSKEESHSHDHSHGNGPSIAGFSLKNIENSISEMTKKLALDVSQQQALRELLTDHGKTSKELRKKFTQSRSSVLKLNPVDSEYESHRNRLVETASYSFHQALDQSVITREKIFSLLNETQQKILLNLE